MLLLLELVLVMVVVLIKMFVIDLPSTLATDTAVQLTHQRGSPKNAVASPDMRFRSLAFLCAETSSQQYNSITTSHSAGQEPLSFTLASASHDRTNSNAASFLRCHRRACENCHRGHLVVHVCASLRNRCPCVAPDVVHVSVTTVRVT